MIMLSKNNITTLKFTVFLMFFSLLGVITAASAAQQEPNESKDLFEMSLEELMEVEVVSTASLTATTRQITPSAVTVITQQQISDSGARNLYELLDIFLPNFQWTTQRWEGRRSGLRGLIGNYDDKFLLLVNGRILNQQTDFGAFTERDLPMMSDIERIEVVRGPGSALYGPGALVMVINMITYTGKTFQGTETTFKAGAIEKFASFEAKHGLKLGEDSDLFFFGGISRYPGASADDSPTVLGRQQTYNGVTYDADHLHKDFFQNSNSFPNNKFKFHLQYNKGNAEIWARYTRGGENLENADVFDVWTPVEWVGYTQKTIYGSYLHEISPEFSLKYSATYDRSTRDPSMEDYWTWFFREERYQGRILGHWNPNEKHSVAVGTEVSYEMFGRPHHGEQSKHWRFYYTPQTGWQPDMPQWETYLWSVFGEHQWRISDYWTTFVSARLDDHTFTDSMFSPKGTLIYTPTERDAVKLIASKAVRTNTATEMKVRNMKLGTTSPAEELKAYELRYERQCNPRLFSAFSLFFNDHDDIGWTDSPVWWTESAFMPTGNVKSWGLEAEMKYKTNKMRIDMSHSYTKLIDVDFFSGITVIETTAQPMGYGNDFAHWSNHLSKIALHYDMTPQWGFDGSMYIYWGYPGGKDYAEYRESQSPGSYEAGFDKTFDPSVFVNLGVSYKFSENTKIQLTGYNLAGLFDQYANKRKNGFNTVWPAQFRIQAPAIAVSLIHKF